MAWRRNDHVDRSNRCPQLGALALGEHRPSLLQVEPHQSSASTHPPIKIRKVDLVISIRTNIASLTAQRNLSITTRLLGESLAKLSSGYRITRASDDAAGLGVATNLAAQIRSYDQGVRNANDGQSVVQTAEAALNESSNILIRVRELAMQSSSDGISNAERAYITEEKNSLIAELDRIDASTEFSGRTLFGAANAMSFQVGIRATANDFISLDTTAMDVDSASLGVDAGTIDLGTDAATSRATLTAIDAALDSVSNFRSQLGAVANRLSSVITTIQVASESASAARSAIMDVDIAAESARLSSLQVLGQAAISVLAQANQGPQIALKLLG
ncbi:MAG: flagellin FliC [Deltaproteobacteria bacterium]|nr:flagellin FliC [Deltaproteobacteria bacterium]